MVKKIIPMLLAIFILAFDQYTKYLIKENLYLGEVIPVIGGFFNIIYVKNSGVAFGIGATTYPIVKMIFFRFLPVIACFWLIYLIFAGKTKRWWGQIAYGLILGGAIGNLIDRFKEGAVVDFFDFYVSDYHFATFNIADSAISIAAVLLIFDYYLDSKKQKLDV